MSIRLRLIEGFRSSTPSSIFSLLVSVPERGWNLHLQMWACFSLRLRRVSLHVPSSSVIRSVHILGCYIFLLVLSFIVMKWPLSLVMVLFRGLRYLISVWPTTPAFFDRCFDSHSKLSLILCSFCTASYTFLLDGVPFWVSVRIHTFTYKQWVLLRHIYIP